LSPTDLEMREERPDMGDVVIRRFHFLDRDHFVISDNTFIKNGQSTDKGAVLGRTWEKCSAADAERILPPKSQAVVARDRPSDADILSAAIPVILLWDRATDSSSDCLEQLGKIKRDQAQSDIGVYGYDQVVKSERGTAITFCISEANAACDINPPPSGSRLYQMCVAYDKLVH